MTEPDEAILWAREDAAQQCEKYGPMPGVDFPAEYRAGLMDVNLDDPVRAYRAGQAASAERIKALEKLVQNLMLEVRARTMRSNTPLTTNIVEMTVPDRVALLKEADQ
jgi:hypothetical protein